MITHYDLFAGIGGFSLALEEVFNDETIRHIFCEWESFPTAVLRQHWPDGEFYGDIAELVADTRSAGLEKAGTGQQTEGNGRSGDGFTIVTGGFPCQPFSAAGRRKGTEDDRYQWPNMFEVIRNTKPEWVIAENVRGLVTWNEGLVLETVCADLESEGYEVQPFIIPAVAVGAPHRRDRVWIIGCRNKGRFTTSSDNGLPTPNTNERSEHKPDDRSEVVGKSTATSGTETNADTRRKYGEQGSGSVLRPESQESEQTRREHPDWSRNWQEVAFATCNDTVDDGLSRIVDGVSYSRAKWRKDSLKAYGNGIVHQVATEILRAVKEQNESNYPRT